MRRLALLGFLLLTPLLYAQPDRELQVGTIDVRTSLFAGEMWAISKPGITDEGKALRITDYAGLPRILLGTSLADQPIIRVLRDPAFDPNPLGTSMVEIESLDLGSTEIGRIRLFNSGTTAEFATLTSAGLTARGVSLIGQAGVPAGLSIQAQDFGNSVFVRGPASTLGYIMDLPAANVAGVLTNDGTGFTQWDATGGGVFVTIATTQTITGAKTITTNNLKLNAIALQIADGSGTVAHSLLYGGSTNVTDLLDSGASPIMRWDSQLTRVSAFGTFIANDLWPSAADTYQVGSQSLRYAGAHLRAMTLYSADGPNQRTLFTRATGGSTEIQHVWPNNNVAGVLTNDGAGNLSWSGGGACGAAGLVQYSGGSGVFDCESSLSYNEGSNLLTVDNINSLALTANNVALTGTTPTLTAVAGSLLVQDASINNIVTIGMETPGGAYDRGFIEVSDDTGTNTTRITELNVDTPLQVRTNQFRVNTGGQVTFQETGGGLDLINIQAPASSVTYNLTLPNAAPATGTQTCGGGTHVSVLVLQNGWVMQVGCS